MYKSKTFIEDIINGMYDWVRVIDRDDTMLFVNKAMEESLDFDPIGKKCYATLGRHVPCEGCISRKAVFDGLPHEKEEIIGDKIFSVMSSPVRNEGGEIIAVVEVLRDVTRMKKLQRQIIEQNKELQDDLSIAKKLQCSLLPKNLSGDKIEFAFVYRPCESLGGDFVDIFQIDDSHIGAYIADVSGHGVPASILTVFLRSSINKHTLSPSQALNELYAEFNLSGFEPNLFITVFYLIIDTESNTLTFSNAGHNVCPVLFNHDRFDILRSSGIPISNWLDNPNYIDKSINLLSGDRIFLYTDGIVEMRNNQQEQFGEERLLDVLLNDKSDISGILNRLIDNACEFAGIDANDILDDITMALIEVKE